jgi:hypothetical protein
VSEGFAEIYRNAGVPNVLAVPNGVSRVPEIRRIPAPDHRVRLGQIGGMARHQGFHLIKFALMASEFDNLSLTVVDLSRARDFRSYEIWGTTPGNRRRQIRAIGHGRTLWNDRRPAGAVGLAGELWVS